MSGGRRAIALLSGGLDSGVATAMWLARGNRVELSLTFDYGQRSAAMELATAEQLANRCGVRWQALQLPWLKDMARASGSALVSQDACLPARTMAEPGDEASARAVWVPARNVVLLAIAAAHAEGLLADVVLAGFNREEAATFKDNSAPFVQAMDAVLALGTRSGVRVVSPTLEMDKPAIARQARQLGYSARDFWSCYGSGPEPCQICESCVRSLQAFAG